MIGVLFICHGNICRSPMAEFVFKDLVAKAGLKNHFMIASVATSREEIGHPVHIGTQNILKTNGISFTNRQAVQLTAADYNKYDYLLCMDGMNVKNAMVILKSDQDHKLMRLLDFYKEPRDIADPWYTGNFQKTYEDIVLGCAQLLKHIKEHGRLTCGKEVN